MKRNRAPRVVFAGIGRGPSWRPCVLTLPNGPITGGLNRISRDRPDCCPMAMEGAQPPGVEVEVRVSEGLARVGTRCCSMSKQELHLLSALLEHAGHVVERSELSRSAWQRPLEPGDRSVDACVYRLRRKLRRTMPEWELIHTHPGFGYRFAPPGLAGMRTRNGDSTLRTEPD